MTILTNGPPSTMKDIYVTLNKVQTHLINWGDPFNCNGRDVIICISGNPGITDFYKEFGAVLHANTGLPVCVIGHAGHEAVPDKLSIELKGQEHLYDLDGQIQHKLDLINNYIDKSSKLHLIGHSIGAWIIIESLQKNKNALAKIGSINLLFPTVQRMAQSINGKFMNNVIRKLHSLAMFVLFILDLLPTAIVKSLTNVYMKINSIPSQYLESIMKLLSSTVLEQVMFLAYNEMDTVTTLNTEMFELIKDRTNVVYNTYDGWAPIQFINDLKQFEPEIKMLEVNIDHSFVLKSSEKVAEIASDFILTKR